MFKEYSVFDKGFSVLRRQNFSSNHKSRKKNFIKWNKHFLKADTMCRINSVLCFLLLLKDSSYIIFFQIRHFWNKAFIVSEYSENLRYFHLYQVAYMFVFKTRRVHSTLNCGINTIGNFINRFYCILSICATN